MLGLSEACWVGIELGGGFRLFKAEGGKSAHQVFFCTGQSTAKEHSLPCK